MKIATYNVWNSEAGMPERFEQLVRTIVGVEADIVCLQEVSSWETHDRFARFCGYDNAHWQSKTGLSILSKYAIGRTADFEYGTSAWIQADDRSLLIINVHLPWERASMREKAIVDITKRVDDKKADFTLLAGDFNCSDNSSIHRFLMGEQSLLYADAYYFDLAEAFAEINGTKAPATLNFRENPRWNIGERKNTIETNQRFDRILLKNPYPEEFPVLKDCKIFGTEVSTETGLSASDHYGVVAEVVF